MSTPQRAPLRTLIVDDDRSVASIHRLFVEAHEGFTVVGEAHSGAAALEQVELLAPDVVLLDVYLPDFSGLEVLSRLSVERARRVEVIAVTAARDLASVREARANGVRHYLVKPFTASALRERLDEVLHHHTTLQRSRGAALDQRTVDEILGGSGVGNGSSSSPPKGVSAATLKRVSAALSEAHGDLSASQLAERVGMSRVGARRYLEYLVARGLASVEPRYGATGRPENRYRSPL
ncbi:response regulator [Parafrigoribacterium mesophilum]|uniref:response regulator n=1 Tax=Parafrigoribacterium mesophilum TaxID=433646 RepID=UPI0031FC3B2F